MLEEASIGLRHKPNHHPSPGSVVFAPHHANGGAFLAHFLHRGSDVLPLKAQLEAFAAVPLQSCNYSCFIDYNFDYFIILNLINFAPITHQRQHFNFVLLPAQTPAAPEIVVSAYNLVSSQVPLPSYRYNSQVQLK
jgi:hypothetical protein